MHLKLQSNGRILGKDRPNHCLLVKMKKNGKKILNKKTIDQILKKWVVKRSHGQSKKKLIEIKKTMAWVGSMNQVLGIKNWMKESQKMNKSSRKTNSLQD